MADSTLCGLGPGYRKSSSEVESSLEESRASYVMLIGSYPRQEGVRPDCFAGCLSQVGNRHSVLVGARGLGEQLLHQRVIKVCVPEEVEGRGLSGNALVTSTR
jgi:hypothetical protein